MNKKLLALLLVGATASQTARAVDVKGFFKAANALLNPIDMTGQKHVNEEKGKYVLAYLVQTGQNKFSPIVKDNGRVGHFQANGNDQQEFVDLKEYEGQVWNEDKMKSEKMDDSAVISKHFNDNFVTVKGANGTEYYIEKDGNNPKVDSKGFEIVTKEAQDVSVGDQGWAKLNEFRDAEKAHEKDNKTPGGKTSEALWGFRQTVLGQRTSGALIVSGWGAVIGTAVLAHSMAKASDDDEDEDENESDDDA